MECQAVAELFSWFCGQQQMAKVIKRGFDKLQFLLNDNITTLSAH